MTGSNRGAKPDVLTKVLPFLGIGAGLSFSLTNWSAIAQPPPSTRHPATQSTLWVHPTRGNDATATGSLQSPFKTISRAFQVAQAGNVVQLAPGVYSAETGERFPLRLKPRVVLRGDPGTRGQGILIRGGGSDRRRSITVLAGDRATLSGVTIANPNHEGIGLWAEAGYLTVTDSTFASSGGHAIVIAGNSTALIRNNYVTRNRISGLTIGGTARPQVEENIFEQTGAAVIVDQSAAPRLVGNRITQNQDGIWLQGNAQPVLRKNSVEGNDRDGLVILAKAMPNLGNHANPGGNFFRNNHRLDINAKALTQPIATSGNRWGTVVGQISQPSPVPQSSTTTASRPPTRRTPASSSTQLPAKSIFPAPTSSKAAPANPTTALPVMRYVDSSVNPPASKSRSTTASAPFPTPSLNQTKPDASDQLASFRPIQVMSWSVPADYAPVRTIATVRPPIAPPPTTPRRTIPATPLVSPATGSSQPIPALVIPKTIAPKSAVTKIQPPLAKPPSGSIPIPVPPPETGEPAAQAATVPIKTTAPPAPIASTKKPDILPVPNAKIPVGYVGNMPKIYVAGSGVESSIAGLTARYRVLVEVVDDRQQAQIQAIVPNAFLVSAYGRTTMQVGAFGERSRADQLVQTLAQQGLQATVEPTR